MKALKKICTALMLLAFAFVFASCSSGSDSDDDDSSTNGLPPSVGKMFLPETLIGIHRQMTKRLRQLLMSLKTTLLQKQKLSSQQENHQKHK